MKKKKKYTLTLMEMMVVIVLIGIIGSVIAVNMKGSLDKGRAFKTQYARDQIKDILMLAVAEGNQPKTVVERKKHFLRESGMVKDVDKLLKDGWNQDFVIECTPTGEIEVSSPALDKYEKG